MTPYFVFLILASFSGFGTGTTVTTSVLSAQALATEKKSVRYLVSSPFAEI
ncbi:TPA: hypothetical protein QFC48_000071 [Enterococcus faecium]